MRFVFHLLLLVSLTYSQELDDELKDKKQKKLSRDEMEALAQKLDGEVLKLTHQEFPEKVSRNTWMIFFGTKWCKFCQRLMPKWSRLELRCKENIDPKLNFNVAKVDCTEDEDFCEHYGVDGYPTILLFSNGKVMEEYHNEQSIGSLVEYALSMSKKYRSEENEEL